MLYRFFVGAGAAVVSIGIHSAAAQNISQTPSLPPVNPVLPSQEPIRPIVPTIPLPATPSPALETPRSPSVVPELPSGNQSLIVKQFRLVGNTVISTEELNRILAPYVGRSLTFSELIQARSLVTSYYVEKGYITSGAFLPTDQNQSLDPSAAIVTIQIVEGRVEEIQVLGVPRLQRYVRQRLRRSTEPVLNRTRLEEALRLLQIDPLIRSLSAKLTVGTQANLSVLTLEVEPQPTFTAEVGLNNSRSPSVGSFERQVGLSAQNLLGQGDIVSLDYRNTTGSNGVETSLTVPFNASNGTVNFGFSTLSSNIIESPFDQLDIEAKSRIYEIGVRQPLFRQATPTRYQEFAVGLTGSRIESETTLLNEPFPLSPGADNQGRTRITALRFFQDYTNQTSRFVLVARSQFSLGLNLLDATDNPTGPDGQFFAWRGQVLSQQQLLGASRLLLRGDIQLADRPLVSPEQFSLGGPNSVRGYRQDALLSDSGAFGSAELQIPLLNNLRSRLDVVPFFDLGTAWNLGEGRELSNSTLASTGIGLQYRLIGLGNDGSLLARLNYGIPLIDISLDRQTLQEQGLSFLFVYRVSF